MKRIVTMDAKGACYFGPSMRLVSFLMLHVGKREYGEHQPPSILLGYLRTSPHNRHRDAADAGVHGVHTGAALAHAPHAQPPRWCTL
jgi:hypothetical protein